MIAIERKKLEQVFEALEQERDNYRVYGGEDGAPEYIYKAITVIKEALAQPVQDVDYWITQHTAARQAKGEEHMTKLIDPRDSLTSQLLYQVNYGSYNWERAEDLMLRAVKEIKKLEKQRKKVVKLSDKDMDDITDNAISIVDAILLTEAKLKEKNK